MKKSKDDINIYKRVAASRKSKLNCRNLEEELRNYCQQIEKPVNVQHAFMLKDKEVLGDLEFLDGLSEMVALIFPAPECIQKHFDYIRKNETVHAIIKHYISNAFIKINEVFEKPTKDDVKLFEQCMAIITNKSEKHVEVRTLSNKVIGMIINSVIHRAPKCEQRPYVLFRSQDSIAPWDDGKLERVSRRFLSTTVVANRMDGSVLFVYHLDPGVKFLFISPFEWEFLLPTGLKMKLLTHFVSKITKRYTKKIYHIRVMPVDS